MNRSERGYGNKFLNEKFAQRSYDKHKMRVSAARQQGHPDFMKETRTLMNSTEYNTLTARMREEH